MSDDDLPRQVAEWLAAQVPPEWFADVPEVRIDRDEIVIVAPLRCPDAEPDTPSAVVERTTIVEFREATREQRIAIASRVESVFERKVSWVASCGSTTHPFTTLNLPVMTRLGFAERQLLDTLVASGVAGSRSEALAWCVRKVGEHEGEWLDELRGALEAVERVRSQRDR